MKLTKWWFVIALGALVLLGGRSNAGVVVFSAYDVGAGPGGPFPLSNAQAALFDAAANLLAPEGLITFESAPLGAFSHLTVAPGVTINGTDLNGNNQTIKNVPNFPSNPPLDGFNTTPGGSNYVEQLGGVLTFTFAQPTQFFGSYITGSQSPFFATDTITFNDGTSQTINIPGTNSSNTGGVAFVGFTDAGKLITSVTINAGLPGPGQGGDFIGIDDVRFQATGATPEPSSVALFLLGSIALVGWRKRKASRH